MTAIDKKKIRNFDITQWSLWSYGKKSQNMEQVTNNTANYFVSSQVNHYDPIPQYTMDNPAY